ncbi:MAG: glycosyltransferase family 9 protein [Alphaproteobacteria bacterium]|nr:glycosyltransferase family 9 protein [Alphaproteobacteria bacterium]
MDKILVIKLGALGDFIYAMGPMAAIRRAHPAAHITLMTTKPFANMARQSGYFNDILIDEKPKFYQVGAWLKLRNTLNDAQFDRVYDLQNNDRTGFYLRLLSPRPEWVGAAKGASHRNTSADRTKYHAYHGHAATLKLAGIEDIAIDPLNWMGEANQDNLQSRLGLKKPLILIVPGSSPQHPEKRWPVEHYRALCAKLIRQGYHPTLIGTKAEADTTAQIAKGFDDVVNLTGQTSLDDLPALARMAVGAIGNDTGPIHFICVTGCPTLVMFCSQKSTIQKHGPQGARVKALESHDLAAIDPQRVFDEFCELALGELSSEKKSSKSA